MNFEHSWGDGSTILYFQNQVHEYLKSGSRILTKDSKGVKVEERTKPLFFHLDDRMKQEITKACEFHNKKVEHFYVHCLNVGNAPGLNHPHWLHQESFFIGTRLKINKASKTTKRIKQDTRTSIWAANG